MNYSYVDLATTQSGDIYFEDTIQCKPLKLSFNLINGAIDGTHISKPLTLSFTHYRPTRPEPAPSGALQLSFNYGDLLPKDIYQVSCIYDSDVREKQIEYAIRTTLTDLKTNSSFGSDLELYMHSNLRDNANISRLSSVISKAVSKFLASPTVEVTPIIQLNHNGYHQSINIKVYNYGSLLTTYSI